MNPITFERLQSLAKSLPAISEDEEPNEMIEPLIKNGMSDDFRAFLEDDAMIDSVLSETLKVLN